MKTREQALVLARSVVEGKHMVGCPIPFSYVGAGIWLSEYVLVLESVANAVESLILHLHGNGKVDLTREEWALFRVVAGQLIDEAVERRVAGLQQEPCP